MKKENDNFKAQTIPFELSDGTTVELTLNFKKMLNVRATRKEAYKRFNEVMMDGMQDIFDYLDVIYMGYLCAAENIEKTMSKEEFYEVVPSNIGEISMIAAGLVRPKKQTDSEKHSEEKPENGQDK